MPNINQLKLSDEELPLNIKAMPSGFGTRPRTPPPGIYRFRLPEHPAIENAFDVMETEDSQILVAAFNNEAMLYNITRTEYYVARINNRYRELNLTNRETGQKEPVLISDYGMLLKALNADPDRISNKHLAVALVKCAGKEFVAEHTLTATCNSKKPIYLNNSPQTGKMGCGKQYAVEAWKGSKSERIAIPLDPNTGQPALRFVCQCGAEIRSWGQLQGFRSV